MVSLIDGDRLAAWLDENASKPPVENPSILVRYALYHGLAERIRNGEFNPIVNDDHDLVMDPEKGD